MDGNGPLDNSDQYSIIGDHLMIANITVLTDKYDKAIRCCEALSNGIVVTGEEYKIKSLGMCCVLRSVCWIPRVWRYSFSGLSKD